MASPYGYYQLGIKNMFETLENFDTIFAEDELDEEEVDLGDDLVEEEDEDSDDDM